MKTLTAKPVTDVKRHATEIIAKLEQTREPIVVTQHGREAAVMLDIESYQTLLRRLDVLESISNGERAFSEGRTTTHAAARERLSQWLDEDP